MKGFLVNPCPLIELVDLRHYLALMLSTILRNLHSWISVLWTAEPARQYLRCTILISRASQSEGRGGCVYASISQAASPARGGRAFAPAAALVGWGATAPLVTGCACCLAGLGSHAPAVYAVASTVTATPRAWLTEDGGSPEAGQAVAAYN